MYIIKQPNGSIRWLHSASELILLGHRLATRIPKFQCFIRYVPLFHPCFWFVLCQSVLSCVFLGCFRVCSHANVLLCVCFQRNLLNNGSKNQNLCLLVEYVTVWTNLGTGGGTRRQQSLLFGSEVRNELVSSDQSMLSKCDDVITYVFVQTVFSIYNLKFNNC